MHLVYKRVGALSRAYPSSKSQARWCETAQSNNLAISWAKMENRNIEEKTAPPTKRIPAQIGARIKEADLDAVLFADPLTDETRKAKRNLLIASFVCVLVAALNLHVNSFLGLTAPGAEMVIGTDLVKGFSAIVVVYSLVAFLFHFSVDYAAWKFELERIEVAPYVDLISLYEGAFRVTPEQIANAVARIPSPSNLPHNYTSNGLEMAASGCLITLTNIEKRLAEIHEQSAPLISSWSRSVAKMARLSLRLKARFAMLWVLDLALPAAVAGLAIVKAGSSIPVVWARILAA